MSSVLAIGTSQGAFLLGESGTEWKILGQGLSGRSVQCLELASDGKIWAGTSSGIYSSSSPEEWQPLVGALSGLGVCALAFHPDSPQLMLYGTSPAGLHVTGDGGHTVQELPALRQHPGASHWTFPTAPYRPKVHRVFLHPRDSKVLIVGIMTGGVYLSGDAGQSWHERHQGVGRQITDLRLHRSAPGRLYAATPIGFYLSEDFGETWQQRNAGLAYPHVTSLGLFPGQPDIAFLASHRVATGGGGIYRSQNAGQRWEACAGLPFQPELAYTCMAVGAQRLVVGTNTGDIYLSRDLGTTWGKVRAALPPIQCLTLIER